ncbi:MAG: FAD-binding protein [Spirochaetes bacterium]|nr:FAD-binding protein [Spirochaetota bacterium]
MKKITTDVLIIGAGISGLVSGILLAEKGVDVCIIYDTEDITKSSSFWAQGGIVYKGKEDSPELLKKDILDAGDHLNFIPAVDKLVYNCSTILHDILIEKIKVPFEKEQDFFKLTGEAAHSVKRILFVKDYTGKAIIESLLNYIKSKNLSINFYPSCYSIDLITLSHSTNYSYSMYEEDRCFGVYAYDEKEDDINIFIAKYTILATGGMGQVYLHTTNPPNIYGNGYAMAYRAHVKLINMEYTQFHPTALFTEHGHSFLISEAVRGEGGELVNIYGKPFMKEYHSLGSLAPRDVVARSIIFEMQKTDSKFVYIDINKIRKKIKDRFPSIYYTCKENGIDLDYENIPVVPSFHFQCGGIKVNLEGESSLDGLYAVGEVSCTGIHGANRLASISLLEGLCFAKFASDSIYNKLLNKEYKKNYFSLDLIKDWEYTNKEEYDLILVKQDLNYLKNIMWNYVGPIRTKKRLRRALTDITNLKNSFEDFYYESKLSNLILQLRDAITCGLIVATSAWKNKKSSGCHYRMD